MKLLLRNRYTVINSYFTKGELINMREEATNSESSSMIVPVLLSGAIGAGLALLLTPKSGREIRSDITRLAKRGGEQAANVTGGTADGRGVR